MPVSFSTEASRCRHAEYGDGQLQLQKRRAGKRAGQASCSEWISRQRIRQSAQVVLDRPESLHLDVRFVGM
jgi:hypothetical protein